MKFCFQKEEPREIVLSQLVNHIYQLGFDKTWLVTIKEVKPTRSLQQNAYLWGVCYQTILDESGLREQGWTNEDLHEYFLGEHFGWEDIKGLGKSMIRPIKRSSKLTVMEFADYIAFVQRKAAEYGVVVPEAA
jgi:hypothetical protein